MCKLFKRKTYKRDLNQGRNPVSAGILTASEQMNENERLQPRIGLWLAIF
jgi:hypothetical protein